MRGCWRPDGDGSLKYFHGLIGVDRRSRREVGGVPFGGMQRLISVATGAVSPARRVSWARAPMYRDHVTITFDCKHHF